jgi:hypothetical protein
MLIPIAVVLVVAVTSRSSGAGHIDVGRLWRQNNAGAPKDDLLHSQVIVGLSVIGESWVIMSSLFDSYEKEFKRNLVRLFFDLRYHLFSVQ